MFDLKRCENMTTVELVDEYIGHLDEIYNNSELGIFNFGNIKLVLEDIANALRQIKTRVPAEDKQWCAEVHKKLLAIYNKPHDSRLSRILFGAVAYFS